MTPPVCLTVAGTDSGGAAGIAADLATFAALGGHGACVITAVTAQDTTGVKEIHVVPPDMVGSQLEAVFGDLPVAAVKTGMLGSAEAVVTLSEVVRARGPRSPSPLALVVDPVLVATSGAVLGDQEVVRAYREVLLPLATVVTPNLDEARALAGHDGPAAELAAELAELGCAVVVTGGFEMVPEEARDEASRRTGLGGLPQPPEEPSQPRITDWLAAPGAAPIPLPHPVVATDNDHGTGCTYSAALAAALAHGAELPEACERAAAYTSAQLARIAGWDLGRGRGPIAHVSNVSTGSTNDEETS